MLRRRPFKLVGMFLCLIGVVLLIRTSVSTHEHNDRVVVVKGLSRTNDMKRFQRNDEAKVGAVPLLKEARGEAAPENVPRDHVVKAMTEEAKQAPAVRTILFAFCSKGNLEAFARALCLSLSRVAGTRLNVECAADGNKRPDYFFIEEGSRSCDFDLPVERQLHESECNHDATVLWTGRNKPGVCPNVLHVAPALISQTLQGEMWLNHDRKTSDLSRFCSLSCSNCRTETQNIIKALNSIKPVDGDCSLSAKDISNYKFVFVSEPVFRPGFVSELLLKAYLSGSVPVYLGAPDVSDFVNPNAFIACKPQEPENCAEQVYVLFVFEKKKLNFVQISRLNGLIWIMCCMNECAQQNCLLILLIGFLWILLRLICLFIGVLQEDQKKRTINYKSIFRFKNENKHSKATNIAFAQPCLQTSGTGHRLKFVLFLFFLFFFSFFFM
jgi:hypothetical protein